MQNLRTGWILFVFCLISEATLAQLYKMSRTLRDFNTNPTQLIAKPNAPLLIQGNSDGSLIFRSSETGIVTNKISAHTRSINNFDFNTTNNLLISTSFHGEIRVYDFEKEEITNKLSAREYSGMKFAVFSIADGFIYFNGYNRLYKTRSDLTQPVQKIYDLTDSITSGIITPDRSALIIAVGKFIYAINPRTDEIIQQVYAGDSPVEKLCMMPGMRLLSWSSDGTVQLWQVVLGQVQTPAVKWFKAGTPSNLAFSNDGNLMVTGNVGNWVRIWVPMQKKIEQELIGHQSAVNAYCFSEDDSMLFTASNDLSFKIWKTKVDTILLPDPPKKDIVKKVPPPAVSPPEAVLREKVNPEVKMESKNIPSQIRNREIKKTETIKLSKPVVDVFVFDNHLVDGDTLSMFFNGEWILKNYGVIKDKKKITLNVMPNTNNYLVLFAENLGSKPPNSAVVMFNDGKQKHYITLNSDLTQCSAINFIYKK